ncbi:uncharacterized protein LOC124272855 [Haliotis rubra]|uniref:uncharacterized protein LOC124272855 n=1 Tax=Haliotis rubra TaxID=36100 RepID=UPI001EE5CEBA|nr:uncharacterized protein LOC124272855 [Haliotis rubra]
MIEWERIIFVAFTMDANDRATNTPLDCSQYGNDDHWTVDASVNITKDMYLAEDGLKGIDTFSCDGCHETLWNPTTFTCLHSYCHECLVKQVTTDHKGERTFRCGQCGTELELTKDGVPEVKAWVYVSRLLDIYNINKLLGDCTYCEAKGVTSSAMRICLTCYVLLCGECNTIHTLAPETRSHRVMSALRYVMNDYQEKWDQPSARDCLDLHGPDVQYYCHTCEIVACLSCLQLDHAGHFFATVDQIPAQTKKRVKNVVYDIVWEKKAYRGTDSGPALVTSSSFTQVFIQKSGRVHLKAICGDYETTTERIFNPDLQCRLKKKILSGDLHQSLKQKHSFDRFWNGLATKKHNFCGPHENLTKTVAPFEKGCDMNDIDEGFVDMNSRVFTLGGERPDFRKGSGPRSIASSVMSTYNRYMYFTDDESETETDKNVQWETCSSVSESVHDSHDSSMFSKDDLEWQEEQSCVTQESSDSDLSSDEEGDVTYRWFKESCSNHLPGDWDYGVNQSIPRRRSRGCSRGLCTDRNGDINTCGCLVLLSLECWLVPWLYELIVQSCLRVL